MDFAEGGNCCAQGHPGHPHVSPPPCLPCGAICVQSLQGDLYFHHISRASHTGVSSLGLGVNPFLFRLPERSGLLPRLWSCWPEFDCRVCYPTVLSFGIAYLPLSTCFLIQKMGSIMVIVGKKKKKHDIFMGGVERVVKCSRVAFVGREQKLIQMNTRKKRSVEGSLRVQP